MGFHCGNTPSSLLKSGELKYQLIMNRTLEPDREPNITRGTLEGAIKAGDVTLFHLQSAADARLASYIVQGQIPDVDPKSFGGIGIFAVPEMGGFYRHVLIGKRLPHHGGVGFCHAGKVLYEALKMLEVTDINYNRPASLPYSDENPYK
jgi:L-fucose isomerase-like protein